MRTVALGRTPLLTSRLVYGCWRIAGTQEAAAVCAESRRRGIRAVQAAYEAGFTGFDLADVYCEGVCEEIFGEALRETPGMRDRVLVATKCGIRPPGGGMPYRYDFSRDHLRRCVDAALRRLRVERIDLLMLHRPDYLMEPSEVAECFAELRTAGKVAAFGVSNFTPSRLDALRAACDFPLAVNQVEISFARTAALDDGTLDHCLTHALTPMAWSPLGGAGADAFPAGLRGPLEAMARERGLSPETLAVAWLLRHPAGIVPVVGTTRPERIRELAGADAVELGRAEWYALLEAALGRRLP